MLQVVREVVTLEKIRVVILGVFVYIFFDVRPPYSPPFDIVLEVNLCDSLSDPVQCCFPILSLLLIT